MSDARGEDLETPFGTVRLVRRHTPAAAPLRAWTAADVLVLDQPRLGEPRRLLVVNDAWGALTVSLAAKDPSVWCDSALAIDSIGANAARNECSLLQAWCLPGHEAPGPGPWDTVAMVVPKSAELLDAQLETLAPLLAPGAVLVAGVMAKHMTRNTVASFERVFGTVDVSRAVRKARTIVASEPRSLDRAGAGLLPTHAFTTAEGIKVVQAPGVFSRDHLDAGTAVLLDTLAADDLAARLDQPGAEVLDLGCGSGVIGATLATRHPSARFQLNDVSTLATTSALATWNANGLDPSRVVISAVDGIGDLEADSIDVVVTNPPFHQDHAVDAGLTDRLLRGAAHVVRETGVVVVVAQRHLRLDQRLRRRFGRVDVRSVHPSHVVMVCTPQTG